MTDAKTDWRSIRCADVQWDATPGVPRRCRWFLFRRCRPPKDGSDADEYSWHDKTLGDVADMGERAWRRQGGWGETATEAVKLTIDYAAAGYDVTHKRAAYVPRPWKEPA